MKNTNKRFWLGMLGMTLAFGMTVIGCSSMTKSLLKLEEDLDYEMRVRATELAYARQRNSDIERIYRVDSISQTDGDFRYLQNTYRVLMRGNILGIITNEVEVIVTGEINIRNNNVRVLDARIP